MITRKTEIAIIGAGTAGLSAYDIAQKLTQDILLINDGLYGTTCARVGCMPSKVMIQVANDFYRRNKLSKQGIYGGEKLHIQTDKALQYVRNLRDYFVNFTLETVEAIGDNNIKGKAQFLEPDTLQVGDQIIKAKKIILAAGSTPFVPEPLASIRARDASKVLTTDDLFELEDLPRSIAVIGSGPLGLESGQALHRMGIQAHVFGRSRTIGGLSDPEVVDYAIEALQNEMPLTYTQELCYEEMGDEIEISWQEADESKKIKVEKVLAATGRRPNVYNIGLEKIGVRLDREGIPEFNPETMQVGDFPIFIAGDVTGELPLLHEASDEGRIAAWNCTHEVTAFRRRIPLSITFSEPNIASLGKSYSDLQHTGYQTGEVRFDSQGRSTIMQQNKGMLHVYGEQGSGLLLGAEMIAPSGEHLAHLLSWAIDSKMTVFDALAAPFYHPVVEEGLRTCLRDLARKIDPHRNGLENPFKLMPAK